MSDLKPPAVNPCGSCPYRRDVAAGVWAAEEYEKLPAYDRETPFQPIGVFLCHQQDGSVCAGWCGTHDMYEMLAMRLVASDLDRETLDAIMEYETAVPLFDTGAEAAEHGLAGVAAPDAEAQKVMAKLTDRRERRGRVG